MPTGEWCAASASATSSAAAAADVPLGPTAEHVGGDDEGAAGEDDEEPDAARPNPAGSDVAGGGDPRRAGAAARGRVAAAAGPPPPRRLPATVSAAVVPGEGERDDPDGDHGGGGVVFVVVGGGAAAGAEVAAVVGEEDVLPRQQARPEDGQAREKVRLSADGNCRSADETVALPRGKMCRNSGEQLQPDIFHASFQWRFEKISLPSHEPKKTRISSLSAWILIRRSLVHHYTVKPTHAKAVKPWSAMVA